MPRGKSNSASKTSDGGAKNRGGRPTASEAEAKAEKLRTIAMEVFVEKGFELTSLSEIARRAGASKETLYSQYTNKSDLFVAVMASHLEKAFIPFTHLVEDRRSLERALQDFAYNVISFVLGPNQQFIHLIFAESQRFPELSKLFWEQSNLRAYCSLGVYLRGHIEKGRLRAEDPNQMARDFLALLAFDSILKSMLNVERSMVASRRRMLAERTVTSFLRIYGPVPS